MKTIKPQRLGVLCRTFDSGDAYFFAVSVLVLFDFRGGAEGPADLLSEVELWKLAAAELGDEPVDLGMPKLRGELLVTGAAFPSGEDSAFCRPRAALGTIDKTLYVMGDRFWQDGVATEPMPFAEMPLRYDRAFGGAEYDLNPTGKGMSPALAGPDGEQIHPLPNIEAPDSLVQSPDDRPPPAGFGPYPMAWPQRATKAGTYDATWREERFPGFPADMDWGIFNAAPEDQQIPGGFRGDEPFVLEHLHPDKPRIEGKLPGVRCRAFVTQGAVPGAVGRAAPSSGADDTDGPAGAAEAFLEVETRLDTVRLFPGAERGILVFHGAIEVGEDDGADILHLVLACEDIGEPKPVEHYQDVLARRLDAKKGHLLVLRDHELMPARARSATSAAEAGEKAVFTEQGLLRKNVRRRLEHDREQARQRLVALGLDPAQLDLPPLPPDEPPAGEDDAALVEQTMADAELAREQAEKKKAEADVQFRAACAARGLDAEKVLKDAEASAGGPPKYSAAEELAKMRAVSAQAKAQGIDAPEVDATLADPGFEERLRAMELRMKEAYRRFVHHYPAARLDAEGAARARSEVARGLRAGRSFAGCDLTGADLSGLDLAGADFRGAMLERATLTGADLRGTDMTEAVLARADLTFANLAGAKLGGANLGLAKLSDADLGSADLTGAVLTGADLSGASLQAAVMPRADLSEAILAGADFSRAQACEASFIKTDLSGAKLAGADMSSGNFIESRMAGVDFRGAKLVSAVLLAVQGAGAVFRDADLTNLRVVEGSCLEEADFRDASLDGANLRGSRLARSDFGGARLRNADLSQCDLRDAVFHRASAAGARFVRADLTGARMGSVNLMEGSLAKATLHGTDLRGANLFGADLSGARSDADTRLRGAHVKRVRAVQPRSRTGHRPAGWPLPGA